MKNEYIVLIKALLKSTSGINILKYGHDKKKKNRVIGTLVAKIILYILLALLGLFVSWGAGVVGLYSAVPRVFSIMIFMLSFMFTLLKSNSYLFGFKEYDMLLSMPFSERMVVFSKLFYMYIKNMPLVLVASISMLTGYIIFAKAGVVSVVFWIVLTFVMPIIPMVIASLLGSIVVRIGTHFKLKTIVQTILLLILMVISFSLNYIIEAIAKNFGVNEIAKITNNITDSIGKYLFSVKWFEKSISETSILYFMLLVLVSFAILCVFVIIVSKSYRKINSRLTSMQRKRAKKSNFFTKKRNIVFSIAKKEFKSLLGSSVYMVNTSIGQLFTVIILLALLVFGPEKLIRFFIKDPSVNINFHLLISGIAFYIHFFIGMLPTTCISPSFEGKRFWIIKTLPISPMKDCYGKMLFNFLYSAPFSILCVLVFMLKVKATVFEIILSLILSLILCMYATVFGMLCGYKFRKLDWENEVEVVKQGASIFIYMFSNMFSILIFAVLATILTLFFESYVIMLVSIVLFLSLTFLFYGLLKICVKNRG